MVSVPLPTALFNSARPAVFKLLEWYPAVVDVTIVPMPVPRVVPPEKQLPKSAAPEVRAVDSTKWIVFSSVALVPRLSLYIYNSADVAVPDNPDKSNAK